MAASAAAQWWWTTLRLQVNKAVHFFLTLIFCLFLALPAYAETWHWEGKGVSGNADIRTFNSVRMAAVDQIIDDLGYKTSLQKEELLVRARTGLRFVHGAAAVWLGYSVISLPARTRVEDGHWWVEANAALRVFSQFLKKNGRSITLSWRGTGTRNKNSGAGSDKVQNNDKQPSVQASQLPVLKALRWGGDQAAVRVVFDLADNKTPIYSLKDETLTVNFAPLSSAVQQSLKAARPDISLKVQNGRTSQLLLNFPGRTAHVFMLKNPSRLVADLKQSPSADSTKDKDSTNQNNGYSSDEQPSGKGTDEIVADGNKEGSDKEPLPSASSKNSRRGSRKKIVVIDAGHGGKDPGAMAHGYREKDIALKIATRVAEEVKKNGVTVHMTRTGDTYPTLRERTAMANNWDADVFISIHLNALPKGRHSKGIEIYIMALPTDKDAMTLAKIENAEIAEGSTQNGASDKRTEMLLSILGNMQQNAKIGESTKLAEELFQSGQKSGLNMKRVAQAPFWVLRGAGMPSVLIETGFITELSEVRRLAQPAYQQKLAKAIAAGIINFIK